jgi:hypothetical protein
MAKIRLSKAARNLNRSYKEIIDFAEELGVFLDSNPNQEIEPVLYEKLKLKLSDKNKIQEDLNETRAKTRLLYKNSVSNLYSITELFDNRVFRIPDYQRGYSWSEKHLNELWNDLENIYSSNMHFTGTISLEPISNQSKDRFIKEDVIKKHINKSLEVEWLEEKHSLFFIVDGQQRLTSLLILLCVLHSCLKKKEGKDKSIGEIDDLIMLKIHDETLYKFGYEKDSPSHQFLLREILNVNIEITDNKTITQKIF